MFWKKPMDKQYRVENMRCASCADQLERKIRQLPYVEEATLSVTRKRLVVRYLEQYPENHLRILQRLARDVEEGVVLSHGMTGPLQSKQTAGLVRIGAAFVLLLSGLIIPGYGPVPLLIFVLAYLLAGGDIVWKAVKNLSKGKVFDENFLMTVATLGAFGIREYPEAVAVMLFYKVGEWFQNRAVDHSRQSIEALMDIRPESALWIRNGEDSAVSVHPTEVPVGGRILVRPGDRIPLDGVVLRGTAFLDTMALTGEAVPRRFRVGEEVLSGSIVVDRVLEIEVIRPFGESAVSRILELVENASASKAPTEQFITRFSRVYTPIVVGLALLIMVLPPLFGGPVETWIYNGLVFLVISCPCALVISVPLGFFGGLGRTSRLGVLVKGGNALEALGTADTLVFDKTGTLTRGVFLVSHVRSYGNLSSEEVLHLAAELESGSNHPIARSILEAAGLDPSVAKAPEDMEERPGRGLVGRKDGARYLVGNSRLLEEEGLSVPPVESIGTVVYVARDNEVLGAILIEDEIREEALESIQELRDLGIRHMVMLTGDSLEVAAAVAGKLALETFHAELLPEDKVRLLEDLIREGHRTLFIGDGINDAPVLALADVGIAMGDIGSDVAIEAADVVIMTDDLSALPRAVSTARRTRRIVTANIVMALGIKALVMVLGVQGFATLWMAVFADVGVALLAVANALRILRD